MRIVGLDLSLTGTGYCHPDGETETLSSPLRGMERIRDLAGQVMRRLVEYGEPMTLTGPDLVVIEDYAFASRSAHAHEIGELGGVIKDHLIEYGLRYVTLPPASIKKFATNRGNANKIEMAVAAAKLGKDFEGDDNRCDAWWLLQVALYRYLGVGGARSAYKDEVVSKIAWPELGDRAECSA